MFGFLADILKSMKTQTATEQHPDVDVVALRALRGYRLWVKFADGGEGIADLSDVPHGQQHHIPFHSMREFKKVALRDRTATWDTDDGGIVHFSPFTLYVRAGLATWDVFMEPVGAPPLRAISVRDCEGGRLWVEIETGRKGFIKPDRDMNGSMDEFSSADKPAGESFISTTGDIVWKNQYWLETEDVDIFWASRRNGRTV